MGGYNSRGSRLQDSTMSATSPPQSEKPETSFAETALKLGGKSDDEARRTGAIDKADDQVEQLFAKRFQTVNSPVHRAIWERGVPVEEFECQPKPVPPEVTRVMNDSLEVMRRHVKAGTNLDERKKVP